MSIIDVRQPGLFTTVQDLGREGYGPLGVSPSGAADAVALRLGNRLVGNEPGAAALEMTLLGGAFTFRDDGVVALTGSDFGATLDGANVTPWMSFVVRAGSTLRVGPTRSGARSYLCVHGGILVRPFLGSASTHVMTGLGGLEGRALRQGDQLTVGAGRTTFRKRTVLRGVLEKLAPRKVLRVTAGEQSEWFPESSRRALFESAYRVLEQSNRMGIRLDGPPIVGESGGEMITEGVSLGAIQVAAGGLPIILFVEQQTTGGYPKIANVVSADIASLGQLRPRDDARFELVDFDAARVMWVEQERLVTARETILE
jgi:antagonist of KipI